MMGKAVSWAVDQKLHFFAIGRLRFSSMIKIDLEAKNASATICNARLAPAAPKPIMA